MVHPTPPMMPPRTPPAEPPGDAAGNATDDANGADVRRQFLFLNDIYLLRDHRGRHHLPIVNQPRHGLYQ